MGALGGRRIVRDRLIRCGGWGVPIATAIAMAFVARHDYLVDAGVFVPAGRALLSGHWSRTFADPAVQAGPLELFVYGGSDLLGRGLGVPFEAVASFAINVGVALSVIAIAGSMFKGAPGLRLGQFAGGMGAALGLSRYAFDSGHPAE